MPERRCTYPAAALAAMTLVLAGAVIGSVSSAEEPNGVPDIARRAFDNMPRVTGQWAFTRTRENEDGTRIERFDPTAEPKWQLVSVDGRDPDAEEREDYAEEIERRLSREEGRPGDNDFDGLSASEGWERLEEDDERVRYRFQPAAGATDREDMAKHLEGEMTIVKAVPYVESFRLYSRRPFRAKLVAKIEEFSTQIRMTRLAERAYMPASVTTRVRGSAFGLKDIDRDVRLTYSDFRYVGPEASADRAAGAPEPAAVASSAPAMMPSSNAFACRNCSSALSR